MTRTLDKSKNVQSVKVSWLFENIAGRTINLRIKVQFFDATGHQMYNETKTFENMLAGFKETDYSPFNSVTYAGADAGKVDNVLITTTEMT